MDRFKIAVRLYAAARLLLLCVLVSGGLWAEPAAGEPSSDRTVRFTIAVKVSPDAKRETAETYSRKDWMRAWAEAKTEHAANTPVLDTDTYVTVDEGGAARTFAMREDGVLFELGADTAVALPEKVRKQWVSGAEELRARHYGEMVPWEEAKTRVPLKSKLTVVDMETGLSFRAQRRAGSGHADVQPLTKKDSAVMKQIYGGSWSWKRRAILVLTDNGRPIAASMHGMPHGGDGIPDNGFSGHFCIHFLGSVTHRSHHVDGSHQLMVHKAAGRLDELLRPASPELLTAALFDSLHQQDPALLRAVLQGAPAEAMETAERLLQSTNGVKPDPIKAEADYSNSVTAEVAVKATLESRGRGRRRESFQLSFARETVQAPWIVVGIQTVKTR